MTGADIAKFREFVEILRKANSPELMTQADMRCLLAIAASSHSARLANQELQVQAEWASLVAILYRTDSIHAEIIALYSALADALAAHNEAESVQFATRIIDTFTYYLIEKKLKYNSN